MVVEILEEKLDREYCDSAAKLIMQSTAGHSQHSLDPTGGFVGTRSMERMNGLLAGGGMSDEEMEGGFGGAGGGMKREGSRVNADGILDLPKHWEPMSNSEVCRL